MAPAPAAPRGGAVTAAVAALSLPGARVHAPAGRLAVLAREVTTMHRRTLLLGSAAGLAVPPAVRPAASQPAAGRAAARIGWLTAQREASLTPYLGVFRAALAEAGWVEGRNLEVEYRFGDDDDGRVPGFAAELARLPVSVIVVQGAAVRILARLGLPIPAVYVLSADPVLAGFAESLSRPRASMTGVTLMAAEVNAKRLEILRDLVPGLRRVALVGNPDGTVNLLPSDRASWRAEDDAGTDFRLPQQPR
jgi:putative ABC transport system substrate-binding protein